MKQSFHEKGFLHENQQMQRQFYNGFINTYTFWG